MKVVVFFHGQITAEVICENRTYITICIIENNVLDDKIGQMFKVDHVFKINKKWIGGVD